MPENFITNLLSDLKVELMDEFDKNFERKAFFDDAWEQVKIPNKRGSLMARSGALRRGMRATVIDHIISFTNSMEYAKIQNEGGTIAVTEKMKRYFWAIYYSLVGRVTYSIKTKAVQNTQRNKVLNAEAQYWKALALKKVGDKIKIKPRRFIGYHAEVDRIVKETCDRNFQKIDQYIKQHLKR